MLISKTSPANILSFQNWRCSPQLMLMLSLFCSVAPASPNLLTPNSGAFQNENKDLQKETPLNDGKVVEVSKLLIFFSWTGRNVIIMASSILLNVATYISNILYSHGCLVADVLAGLTDNLCSLGREGRVVAHWVDLILDELSHYLCRASTFIFLISNKWNHLFISGQEPKTTTGTFIFNLLTHNFSSPLTQRWPKALKMNT